jgi:hypothetical protein
LQLAVDASGGLLQDYDVLTTRLESLYLTSPDFTLQTAFLHLHPTLHVLSLLYSLCQSLEYQHKEESDGDDDSDDEEEDMAKYLRAAGKEDGVDASKKGIIGGEVLGIVVERASCLNGFVPTSLLYGRCLDSDISVTAIRQLRVFTTSCYCTRRNLTLACFSLGYRLGTFMTRMMNL